ncbi:hypothetical protein [Streptomyces sp. Mg1]|uniref:hypothetical protein n=1 Tax=Streptomyces sp. Mg1 TaxID=465541 RepID=UPI00017E91B0|nr:hypothetical protein [Streptomyces sp. Mg1]AKL66529.1 hypothetical protein M444_15250 [Streptomyces sp. Mg1]EDX23623.1 hypothetical protein SSAG_03414 [Streptomyces sp. Mg1]
MSRARRPGRAPALVVAAGLLGALAAGCSGASGDASGRGDGRTADPGTSGWVEGATAESVSRTLHVEIPSTATGAVAAHRRGFQDDGLILSFVLPAEAVDPFLTQLDPDRPLRLREQPFAAEATPATPFARLGLPEPDLLSKVREGQVCGPCKGDLNWLKVAVAQINERSSRVYLRGVD